MDPKAGFQAIRQMSVLARDLNQASQRDREWVRKFLMVGGLVVVIIGLLAFVDPMMLGNAARLVSGWVR